MTVSRNKLSKKDLTKIGLRSIMYQTGFNFQRMQAGSFAWCLLPALKKIYGNDTEQIAKSLSNNLDFINTEQHAASFLMGLLLSMEENGEDRELIKSIKTGLFGPFAGLGDAVFWFTLLPITAAICSSLNNQNLVIGPLLFIAIWAVLAYSRVWFVHAGYKLGTSAVSKLTTNAKPLTKAAGILGVMVVGAMVPIYVKFAFPEEIVLFNVVGLQSIFDAIIPNLLPALIVGLFYFLFKKKNINIITLIASIIVVSILLALTGIM